MSSSSLVVDIWRGTSAGSFNTYRVPRAKLQTVLDLVTYVQRELDSELSYRFACRVGMCGTCAMTVNGVPRWTCRTQASVFANEPKIVIAPLRNFPVIKDLVVDMQPFFKKWHDGGGAFSPSRPNSATFAEVKPDDKERIKVDEAIQCINCGICHATCDIVTWKPEYLGPAALNRAWSLVNDRRSEQTAGIMAALASDGGCLSCHTTRSCSRHCPKQLDPSASIAGLKSKAMRAAFRL